MNAYIRSVCINLKHDFKSSNYASQSVFDDNGLYIGIAVIDHDGISFHSANTDVKDCSMICILSSGKKLTKNSRRTALRFARMDRMGD